MPPKDICAGSTCSNALDQVTIQNHSTEEPNQKISTNKDVSMNKNTKKNNNPKLKNKHKKRDDARTSENNKLVGDENCGLGDIAANITPESREQEDTVDYKKLPPAAKHRRFLGINIGKVKSRFKNAACKNSTKTDASVSRSEHTEEIGPVVLHPSAVSVNRQVINKNEIENILVNKSQEQVAPIDITEEVKSVEVKSVPVEPPCSTENINNNPSKHSQTDIKSLSYPFKQPVTTELSPEIFMKLSDEEALCNVDPKNHQSCIVTLTTRCSPDDHDRSSLSKLPPSKDPPKRVSIHQSPERISRYSPDRDSRYRSPDTASNHTPLKRRSNQALAATRGFSRVSSKRTHMNMTMSFCPNNCPKCEQPCKSPMPCKCSNSINRKRNVCKQRDKCRSPKCCSLSSSRLCTPPKRNTQECFTSKCYIPPKCKTPKCYTPPKCKTPKCYTPPKCKTPKCYTPPKCKTPKCYTPPKCKTPKCYTPPKCKTPKCCTPPKCKAPKCYTPPKCKTPKCYTPSECYTPPKRSMPKCCPPKKCQATVHKECTQKRRYCHTPITSYPKVNASHKEDVGCMHQFCKLLDAVSRVKSQLCSSESYDGSTSLSEESNLDNDAYNVTGLQSNTNNLVIELRKLLSILESKSNMSTNPSMYVRPECNANQAYPPSQMYAQPPQACLQTPKAYAQPPQTYCSPQAYSLPPSPPVSYEQGSCTSPHKRKHYEKIPKHSFYDTGLSRQGDLGLEEAYSWQNLQSSAGVAAGESVCHQSQEREFVLTPLQKARCAPPYASKSRAFPRNCGQQEHQPPLRAVPRGTPANYLPSCSPNRPIAPRIGKQHICRCSSEKKNNKEQCYSVVLGSHPASGFRECRKKSITEIFKYKAPQGVTIAVQTARRLQLKPHQKKDVCDSKTEPLSDETEPLSDETEPLLDETEPLLDDIKPPLDETEPHLDATNPPSNQSADLNTSEQILHSHEYSNRSSRNMVNHLQRSLSMCECYHPQKSNQHLNMCGQHERKENLNSRPKHSRRTGSTTHSNYKCLIDSSNHQILKQTNNKAPYNFVRNCDPPNDMTELKNDPNRRRNSWHQEKEYILQLCASKYDQSQASSELKPKESINFMNQQVYKVQENLSRTCCSPSKHRINLKQENNKNRKYKRNKTCCSSPANKQDYDLNEICCSPLNQRHDYNPNKISCKHSDKVNFDKNETCHCPQCKHPKQRSKILDKHATPCCNKLERMSDDDHNSKQNFYIKPKLVSSCCSKSHQRRNSSMNLSPSLSDMAECMHVMRSRIRKLTALLESLEHEKNQNDCDYGSEKLLKYYTDNIRCTIRKILKHMEPKNKEGNSIPLKGSKSSKLNDSCDEGNKSKMKCSPLIEKNYSADLELIESENQTSSHPLHMYRTGYQGRDACGPPGTSKQYCRNVMSEQDDLKVIYVDEQNPFPQKNINADIKPATRKEKNGSTARSEQSIIDDISIDCDSEEKYIINENREKGYTTMIRSNKHIPSVYSFDSLEDKENCSAYSSNSRNNIAFNNNNVDFEETRYRRHLDLLPRIDPKEDPRLSFLPLTQDSKVNNQLKREVIEGRPGSIKFTDSSYSLENKNNRSRSSLRVHYTDEDGAHYASIGEKNTSCQCNFPYSAGLEMSDDDLRQRYNEFTYDDLNTIYKRDLLQLKSKLTQVTSGFKFKKNAIERYLVPKKINSKVFEEKKNTENNETHACNTKAKKKEIYTFLPFNFLHRKKKKQESDKYRTIKDSPKQYIIIRAISNDSYDCIKSNEGVQNKKEHGHKELNCNNQLKQKAMKTYHGDGLHAHRQKKKHTDCCCESCGTKSCQGKGPIGILPNKRILIQGCPDKNTGYPNCNCEEDYTDKCIKKPILDLYDCKKKRCIGKSTCDCTIVKSDPTENIKKKDNNKLPKQIEKVVTDKSTQADFKNAKVQDTRNNENMNKLEIQKDVKGEDVKVVEDNEPDCGCAGEDDDRCICTDEPVQNTCDCDTEQGFKLTVKKNPGFSLFC